MSRLRAWVRSFFGFSRTETNAFLIMVPLMATLVCSTPIYKWWWINHPGPSRESEKFLDSLIATWTWEKSDSTQFSTPRSFFGFNPNKATIDELIRLGISEKMAKRIIHYRSKGGKFKIKKDFSKIYGMDSLIYRKLFAFIDLPEKISLPPPISHEKVSKWTPPQPFDLNLADTTQLIKINGIGQRLSVRITSYRNRLGGFISLDQLQEVYGLDTAVIRRLKKQTFIEGDFIPRQININKANERQLSALPYIRFALAKSIAAYRFQHGEFDSVEAIKKVVLIDEATFQKIKPYITVKE